jgi:hypothetical protein
MIDPLKFRQHLLVEFLREKFIVALVPQRVRRHAERPDGNRLGGRHDAKRRHERRRRRARLSLSSGNITIRKKKPALRDRGGLLSHDAGPCGGQAKL